MMVAGPREPLQREPSTEERIMTMDYVATRAQSKGVPSTPHSQWYLSEATMAFSPPPTNDNVDMLYR
jgi:hypothetical protein